MPQLEEFFRSPEQFLANAGKQDTKLFRQLAAHLELTLSAGKSAEVRHLADLSRRLDDSCSTALAARIEIRRLRLAGEYREASNLLYNTPRGRCLYCDADLLLRGLSIGYMQCYTQRIDFGRVIDSAKGAIAFYDRLKRNAATRGDKGLSDVLLCLRGVASIHYASAAFLSADSLLKTDHRNDALTAFQAAMVDTSKPRGGKVHAYRWWGRLVPCTGLPTPELRDQFNETAFANYTLAVSRWGSASERQVAHQQFRDLLTTVQSPLRSARINWMLGSLMVDDWSANKGRRRDRQKAREDSERHFRLALIGLIENDAPPVDVVACLCDRARLPWQRNPGRVLLSVLKHDPRYSPQKIASYVRALDADLYTAVVEAAERGEREATISTLVKLRDLAGQRKAWPSFMPKAA